ncbi:MAG: CDP-alcohol phosphatidyltransferase family protein [Blautia sp.]|nr:CDP-alcohol phosphatidyltransferase family protein [Blautia sp.]
MIGFYDYTVILTYLSLISGMTGVLICLHGFGHPFIGVFFLMFSGLCDTFDGKVARTKKDRTPAQTAYGIQIDSLADLVAFGVLPPCIGISMLRVSTRFTDSPHIRLTGESDQRILYPIILFAIAVIYVLAAMIRLAYFNVLEEERQKVEEGNRKYYLGLPVTSAALIFPTVMLIQYITRADITLLYFGALLITAFLFVLKFKVGKPQLRGIFIMLAIGLVEFILLLLIHLFRLRH